MTTKESKEVETLADGEEANTFTLSTGREVRLEPINTRHMLRLIKVFTRGAGPMLAELDMTNTSQDAFVGQLLGTLLFAIPEAEDETLEFITSLVVPAEAPVISRRSSRAERQERQEIMDEFLDELTEDPPISDTVEILTRVVKAEAPNLMALGNQIAALLPTAARAEKDKAAPQKKQAAPKKRQSAASKTDSKD